LPREKRQPNLFLAATRHLFGTPACWDQLRSRVLQDKDALRAVMLARSTQTNEPGRCAALLPVLTGLPEPLALLEVVGTGARFCVGSVAGANARAGCGASSMRYRKRCGSSSLPRPSSPSFPG
jgi:hypothetical protein